MSVRETSMKFFKRLARNRDEKYSSVSFKTALDGLATELDDGFTEEEIETLVTVLVSCKHTAPFFRKLILSIVPKTTVSEKATDEVLLWLCSHYETGLISSVILTLQWLTGILDCGLTNENIPDGYYEFFFVFLRKRKLEAHVSKLIYMLTKPEDITRWRVKGVMQVHQMNKHQKYTNAILCQFKSFRPECVPENVPTMNVNSAFRNIPGDMRSRFCKAQVRKQDEDVETGNRVTEIAWGVIDESAKKPSAAKRSKMDLIPSVDYIQFGSKLYNKQSGACSVLQFKTIESLGCYQLSLNIPCQVMSLLVNNAGCHVLTFGDPPLQERLSYILYYQLYSVFIKGSASVSDHMKKLLLVKLIKLESYMQQGIPVVSRILAEFMLVWNGYDFQEQIFKLLEWITFSTVFELHSVILEHIHRFFVQSDVKGKCLIIASMKRLLANLYLEVYRRKNGFTQLFMRDPVMWDSVETLTSVTTFVQDLCTLGLISEPDSLLILHESLAFHEMVSHLQNQIDLPLWTIMTPCIFYRGLFTSNAVVMGRVCALMIRYKNVDYKRLRDMGLRNDFLLHFETIEKYSVDLFNCLWSGKAISYRSEGFIFKNMSKRSINRLNKLVFVDQAFLYRHHYAFAPFILPTLKSTRKDWLLSIKKFIPDLSELLLTCNGGIFPHT